MLGCVSVQILLVNLKSSECFWFLIVDCFHTFSVLFNDSNLNFQFTVLTGLGLRLELGLTGARVSTVGVLMNPNTCPSPFFLGLVLFCSPLPMPHLSLYSALPPNPLQVAPTWAPTLDGAALYAVGRCCWPRHCSVKN